MGVSCDQLTLARAYFKLDELKKSESYFNQAVEGIRKAGKIEFIPMFLLERANFLIKINELKDAQRDLAEAKQLISRSGMKLYEVDYHLTMCNFIIKSITSKSTAATSNAETWKQEKHKESPSIPLLQRGSSPPLVPTLERGNKEWAQQKDSFFKHLSFAKTLIKSTGYHLRDKTVSELETLTF